MQLPSLGHPAYTQAIKLKGYSCHVNIIRATCSADAAKILKRLHPSWSRQDHDELAKAHQAARVDMEREYSELLDVAALQAFGRKYHITDYRISAIACDEFSEEHKERLRYLAHSATKHAIAAGAHAHAARYMRARASR